MLNPNLPRSSSRPARPVRFVSLRWKALFPLSLLLTLVAMVGAYGLALSLGRSAAFDEQAIARRQLQAALDQAYGLYLAQRAEAQRVAYTVGVAEALETGDARALHTVLESLARVSGLDGLIVTTARGAEVAGIQRLVGEHGVDYSVSTQTDLSDDRLIGRLQRGADFASGLWRAPRGLHVVVAAPIISADGVPLGFVLTGRSVESLVAALQASSSADVALFAADGAVLASTLANVQPLSLGLMAQVMGARQGLETAYVQDGAPQRALYAPLAYGESADDVIAALGLFAPQIAPLLAQASQQLVALLAATLAAAASIGLFISVSLFTRRLERIEGVVQALSQGQTAARTGMQPIDEVGALGQAIDQYAEAAALREDRLRASLQQERRERAYLASVLEALPDGVLVQDMRGQTLMVNQRARALLGQHADPLWNAQALGLNLGAGQPLGAPLAPGLYALGSPQRLRWGGSLLQAQSAALVAATGERLGSVVLLRDISREAQLEQERQDLLNRLASEVQQPLAQMSQREASSAPMQGLAREISRHAAALQKMIVDMRELTQYNQAQAEQRQRPLSASALLVAVANDWRQIAQAAGLSLSVTIAQQGLFVLGDESRLRFALGNLVDNAIKYTSPGGLVVLEVQEEREGYVYLRVRDNGAGISPEDLTHAFVPFYRGTPRDAQGQIIRVPGMGQGLPLALQIVQAHGGKLYLKSKPGQGTAAYVALPATAEVGYLTTHWLSSADLEGETVAMRPLVSPQQRP
ncbi:MAG: ATP-binding protein [Anaerolineae bacterium]|nr:ATP-binding protein [Anaerolineae bacterium]MDW8171850.1 ATP-binding protein [Anaerolineae bacterium]